MISLVIALVLSLCGDPQRQARENCGGSWRAWGTPLSAVLVGIRTGTMFAVTLFSGVLGT